MDWSTKERGPTKYPSSKWHCTTTYSMEKTNWSPCPNYLDACSTIGPYSEAMTVLHVYRAEYTDRLRSLVQESYERLHAVHTLLQGYSSIHFVPPETWRPILTLARWKLQTSISKFCVNSFGSCYLLSAAHYPVFSLSEVSVYHLATARDY